MRLRPGTILPVLGRRIKGGVAPHPVVPAENRRAVNHPPADQVDAPAHEAVPKDKGIPLATRVDRVTDGGDRGVEPRIGCVASHPLDRLEVPECVGKGGLRLNHDLRSSGEYPMNPVPSLPQFDRFAGHRQFRRAGRREPGRGRPGRRIRDRARSPAVRTAKDRRGRRRGNLHAKTGARQGHLVAAAPLRHRPESQLRLDLIAHLAHLGVAPVDRIPARAGIVLGPAAAEAPDQAVSRAQPRGLEARRESGPRRQRRHRQFRRQPGQPGIGHPPGHAAAPVPGFHLGEFVKPPARPAPDNGRHESAVDAAHPEEPDEGAVPGQGDALRPRWAVEGAVVKQGSVASDDLPVLRGVAQFSPARVRRGDDLPGFAPCGRGHRFSRAYASLTAARPDFG